MLNDLKASVDPNEEILYGVKPDKKCYIFESIFNPMLPIAILWCVFDLMFIGLSFSSGSKNILLFIIPFFLIHLMSVWIYLGAFY